MTTRLIELIESLGRPRIFVIGDLILDRYVWGRVSRISPEAPIQILEAQQEEFRAGGAANVARNIAALGGRVEAGGVVGSDASGRTTLQLLRTDGVSTRAVVRDPSKPTSTKTRMMAAGHQLLRVDEEDIRPVSARVLDAMVAKARASARDCALAVLSDYHKGTLPSEACRAVMAAFERQKKPVLVGLKSPDYQKYERATGASLNRAELAAISGVSELEAGARSVMRKLKLRFLVVTLGEQGLALYDNSARVVRIPTVARQVFDVTGAGDTLLAAFATAYACGLSLEDSARIGNVAAGIVVGKVGTAVASRGEMIEHLLGGGHLSEQKILPERDLLARLSEDRRKGRRVVFTNGCFDLLHVGHVKILQYAKSQGEVLVVGLNSDASVSRLKGAGRPIVPLRERAQILSALEAVDYVVAFEDETPARLIERIHPDVLVKGEDWSAKGVVGADIVERAGGRVALAPLVRGRSTSDLVRRIVQNYGNEKIDPHR